MLFIQAEQRQVLATLQNVTGIVERSYAILIIQNVLLRKRGNIVEFTTSDFINQIRTEADLGGDPGDDEGAIEPQWVVTIGARKLLEALKTIPPNEIVTLTVKDGKAVLAGKTGSTGAVSRFSLHTLPHRYFPIIKEVDPGTPFCVPASTLKSMLKQVLCAMANCDVRSYLNGVCLVVQGRILYLSASDSKRFALTGHTLEHIPDDIPRQSLVIPDKAAIELQRMLPQTTDNVFITFASNVAKFNFTNIDFTTHLQEGTFPDHRTLIPSHPKHTLTLPRSTLLGALQRASVTAPDKLKIVTILLEKNVLRMSCTNRDNDESIDETPVTYEGVKLNAKFNAAHFIEGINAMDKAVTDVTIGIPIYSDPLQLITHENPTYRYLVPKIRD